MRLEVRISVGPKRGRAAVDDRAIEELVAALVGRALTLRGSGGRRLRVIECRPDPTRSSAAAFIATVEWEDPCPSFVP